MSKHLIEVTTWELAHVILGLSTAIKTRQRNVKRAIQRRREKGKPDKPGFAACRAVETADLVRLMNDLTAQFQEIKRIEARARERKE